MAQGQVSACIRIAFWATVALMVMSQMTIVPVSGRYLPTRSQDDRIDRLRELLKDLLASQQYDYTGGDAGADAAAFVPSSVGRGAGAHTVMFKRDIPNSFAPHSMESTRMV